jgi:hypothetical protein
LFFRFCSLLWFRLSRGFIKVEEETSEKKPEDKEKSKTDSETEKKDEAVVEQSNNKTESQGITISIKKNYNSKIMISLYRVSL